MADADDRPAEPVAARDARYLSAAAGAGRQVEEPTADAPEIESDEAIEQRQAAMATDDPRWRPLIDPVSVIGGIGRSKKLIAATTLIGAAIGVAIALSTPKKYEAFAELLIDPRDLKLTDRDLTQTGLPNDATLAIVENQVRVLTSGTVLNRVVDKLNLTEDSEFNGERAGGIGNFISSLRALLSSGNGAGARRRPPPCACRQQSGGSAACRARRQDLRRVDRRHHRRAENRR